MVEYNSPNIYSNLNDQQQFRLNKISEVTGVEIMAGQRTWPAKCYLLSLQNFLLL